MEIGLEQLGTFRCFFLFPLFFFIPPPFSSASFPFLLSFFLFFSSLGWMSLFYSGRNKGREPATPGNIPFFEEEERKVFQRANPRRSLKCGGERVDARRGRGRRGGPGFCAESLVNGCPTRALSLSLCLSLPFLPSRPGRWLSRAPCHAVQHRAMLVGVTVLRAFLDIPVATEAPASLAGPVNPPGERNFFAELSKPYRVPSDIFLGNSAAIK